MLKSTGVPVRSSFNSMKPVYLLLTLVGSIAPWFWLLQDPTVLLSPTLFLQKAFENNISAALTSDLLISAIAFFCFVWIELKRLDISRLWLLVYVGLTFGVGLSCALPFFLYSRGQVLEQNEFR
jgi:Terpene cyclase DEP1